MNLKLQNIVENHYCLNLIPCTPSWWVCSNNYRNLRFTKGYLWSIRLRLASIFHIYWRSNKLIVERSNLLVGLKNWALEQKYNNQTRRSTAHMKDNYSSFFKIKSNMCLLFELICNAQCGYDQIFVKIIPLKLMSMHYNFDLSYLH